MAVASKVNPAPAHKGKEGEDVYEEGSTCATSHEGQESTEEAKGQGKGYTRWADVKSDDEIDEEQLRRGMGVSKEAALAMERGVELGWEPANKPRAKPNKPAAVAPRAAAPASAEAARPWSQAAARPRPTTAAQGAPTPTVAPSGGKGGGKGADVKKALTAWGKEATSTWQQKPEKPSTREDAWGAGRSKAEPATREPAPSETWRGGGSSASDGAWGWKGSHSGGHGDYQKESSASSWGGGGGGGGGRGGGFRHGKRGGGPRGSKSGVDDWLAKRMASS